MGFRKIIFWLHLIAGVVVGVIVFVMSVTGVMLAYERQLTGLAEKYPIVPPTADAKPLPIETLLAKAREAQSNGVPAGITLRADNTAAATVSFGRERTLFLNPYTGEVVGDGAKKSRAFFQWVTGWHRWLGTNDTGRAVGRGITGACNLAFLFLVISGFYLWWPRSWSAFKSVIWFARGVSGKARDWNWHNVIGFWCAVPLFFIVLTGVIMSYPWANNLLYRITGSELSQHQQRGGEAPASRSGREGGSEPGRLGNAKQGDGAAAREGRTPRERARETSSAAEIKTDGVNAAWAIAEKKVVGWNYIILRFAPKPGGPLTFLIDRGNGPRPDLRSTLTLNAETGEEIRWQPYSTQSAGQKARAWGRFIHTGEAGGFIGQTIAGAASLGGAVLVWTGFALAWRRFKARKRAQT